MPEPSHELQGEGLRIQRAYHAGSKALETEPCQDRPNSESGDIHGLYSRQAPPRPGESRSRVLKTERIEHPVTRREK